MSKFSYAWLAGLAQRVTVSGDAALGDMRAAGHVTLVDGTAIRDTPLTGQSAATLDRILEGAT